MADTSVFQQGKALEQQLGSIIASIDPAELPPKALRASDDMQAAAAGIRLYARDYEYAETRADQLQLAGSGKALLEQLQKQIVEFSQYGSLAPADVAQLSARAQQLMTDMA